MEEMQSINITGPFEFIWDCFLWVVDWTKTHGIIVGAYTITWYEIAIGVALILIVTEFILIFGEGEPDDE